MDVLDTSLAGEDSCIPLTLSLVLILKADDVRALEAVVASASASVCLADHDCYFDPMLQQRPPLVSVCCYYGAIHCLEFLLTAGASCSVPDREGRFPHHFAAAGNQIRALVRIREALLDRKSNADEILLNRDSKLWTVFHFAARADAVDVFHYFSARLGPPTIFDVQAQCSTPLQIACLHHSIKCIRFFADLNFEARKNNRPDLPIDFNVQNNQSTPIVSLLKARASEVIPMAVRAGMHVDSDTGNGWPVLFHAIRINAVNFTRVLCRIGANPSWRCALGWTPFHIAAQERLPAVCRLLWKFGGCPHSLTPFGQSPFTLARPIHKRDLEGQTAKVVRAIIVEYCARAVMIGAAKSCVGNAARR
jgi:ankyrin repeat protein